MKLLNKPNMALSAAAFTASALMLMSPLSLQAGTVFTIEPTHTSIDLHYNHLGYSRMTIRFMSVSGTIDLDENKVSQSKVDIEIDTTKINSGVAVFDDHLKAEKFFDTANHPKASFQSTKITQTADTTADIEGNLTIKGIIKPVVLKAKLNKKGLHPMAQKMAVGFSATTSIKRTDFGMSSGVPYVSDQVDIVIEAEALAK
jgi:polyisoprenoid-binding protein YceI